MRYKLIASISKSLLLARLKQTLVAAIGVTFSITMFITLLSFMSGMNDLLDGLILNRTAHIRLYKEIKPSDKQPIDISEKYRNNYNFVSSIKPKNENADIRNYTAIMRSLKADKRVTGIAPKIITQVFYNVGSIDLTGTITLTGDIGQTGNTYITGLFSNNNVSITGTGSYLQVPNIKILDNTISTTTGNLDLAFIGTGSGGVTFDNKLKISGTTISNIWPSATTNSQKNILFSPNGTGSVVVDATSYLQIPYSNKNDSLVLYHLV
jgi:hypothetical protein